MVAVTLMWSTAGVVTRHLEHAQRFEVTFWRSFFTVVSLLVILPLLQGRDVFSRMRHGGAALWISGLCWSGMFTFFMLAMMLTTVANVLVMLALSPLFTAIAARIFIGHRIALRTWVAIGVAGIGIATLYANQLGSSICLGGTLIALCVPISGAANWTVTQHAHAQGRDVDMMPAVLIGGVISSLITLPMTWPFQASGHDVLLLAGLGLVQLAIPCVLAVMCTKALKAPEMALLGVLEIIFGILLAWVGAGEVPGPNVLLGGTLVIGSLVVNEFVAWRGRA
jgi:drug/metabolite transporter (DMT)-like permease